MAERHHHHHHHQEKDDVSEFKRKSLLAIRRRKVLAKWSYRVLCVVAVVMGLLVLAAYTIG